MSDLPAWQLPDECGHRWTAGTCGVMADSQHACGLRTDHVGLPSWLEIGPGGHWCPCGAVTGCTLRWPGPCTVYMHGHRCVNPPDMPHQCACGATT